MGGAILHPHYMNPMYIIQVLASDLDGRSYEEVTDLYREFPSEEESKRYYKSLFRVKSDKVLHIALFEVTEDSVHGRDYDRICPNL